MGRKRKAAAAPADEANDATPPPPKRKRARQTRIEGTEDDIGDAIRGKADDFKSTLSKRLKLQAVEKDQKQALMQAMHDATVVEFSHNGTRFWLDPSESLKTKIEEE